MSETARAGDLRINVQLQAYTTTTGDRGQAVPTWTTYATAPAMIEELGGRKLELARQLVATATHRVTVRYNPTLKVTDRVLYGSSVFAIGAVQDTGLYHFTQQLTCTSQDSGA